jgi:hypothetical protein
MVSCTPTFHVILFSVEQVEPGAGMTNTDFDHGFVAGLLVGAGSFSGDADTPSLSVKLHEDDPQPLHTLHQLLGGTIYGPYNARHHRYYVWLLRGRRLTDALPLLDAILPPGRKRTLYLAWKRRYGFLETGQATSDLSAVNEHDL